MKKFSYLMISVLLHGTFLGLMAALTFNEKTAEPIQLELVGDSSSTTLTGADKIRDLKNRSKGRGVFSSKSAPSKLSAKDMALGRQILQDSGSAYDPAAAARAGGSPFATALNDNQVYSEAESSIFGQNDNWAFHQEVYRNVDSQLMFDSVLARYDHFGTVYLEFSVDSKGYLQEQFLRASAEDAILKVHAVRALRKALGKEFESTKWSVLEKPVVFRAKFEFTKEGSDINFKKQKAFSDPVFVFRRATNEGDIASFLSRDQSLGGLGGTLDYEEAIKKYQNRYKNRVLKSGDYDPFLSYKSDPAYSL